MLPHWFNHKLLNLVKFKNFEDCPITKCDNSIHCLLKVKDAAETMLKPLVITSEPTLWGSFQNI